MPTPPPDDIHIPARRPRPQPEPAPDDEALSRPRRRKPVIRRVLLALFVVFVALPLALILLGRVVPIAVTSYMLQSPTRPVAHDWVPKERIAEVARRAVVAAEDQKFWDHRGFDVEAMQKAYERNRRGGRVRGGSTISQQTAKNLFLWPGGGYARKGIEAGLTVLIETLWSKERILEVYLNSAEFGPGIYGVEAAAQHYFGKSAAQLTASEAARLAAVLPNPRQWKLGGGYVQSRASWIQRQMGYAGRRPPIEDAEPAPPPGEEIPNEDDEPDAAPHAASEPPPPASEPPAEAAPETAAPPAEAPPAEAPAAGADAPAGQPLPEPEEAPAPVPVPP